MSAPGVVTATRVGLPSYVIVAALRRSRARRLVLRHLATTPADYVAGIARATSLCPAAIFGALRGLGQRYVMERSLVGLGLVREVDAGDTTARCRFYEATDLGLVILQQFPRE